MTSRGIIRKMKPLALLELPTMYHLFSCTCESEYHQQIHLSVNLECSKYLDLKDICVSIDLCSPRPGHAAPIMVNVQTLVELSENTKHDLQNAIGKLVRPYLFHPRSRYNSHFIGGEHNHDLQ
jgi:hypothetical protein